MSILINTPVRPGNYPITDDQYRIFFLKLREYGNLTHAAREAGFEPSNVYRWQKNDPEFAAQYADALKEAGDVLHMEARRRAYEGNSEPVVSNGRLVKDEAGRPLYTRRYSDMLMTTMLKAHKPDLFDRGTVISKEELPEALRPHVKPIPDEAGPSDPVE